MKVNKINNSQIPLGYKIESKVFYKNRVGSRVIDKITLDSGERVFIDTTTLYGKTLCKFLSLYDKTGNFVKTLAKSYKDGKSINTRYIDWE